MKNTTKLFLIIALFCTTAFADGNMGSGGLTDDGNMGSGGKTCTGNCVMDTKSTAGQSDSKDSLIEIIQDYLVSIFG